jgi:hypothetical protein
MTGPAPLFSAVDVDKLLGKSPGYVRTMSSRHPEFPPNSYFIAASRIYTQDDVDAIRAWVGVHGLSPEQADARRRRRSPLDTLEATEAPQNQNEPNQ